MSPMRVDARAGEIFDENLRQVRVRTHRVFIWLFLAQWALAVALALVISPYAWSGPVHVVHLHVELALFGGAVLNALPIALILLRPDWIGTRHIVAVTQMLWSAIFVHLTGGRVETHFHIFGSLAFLSFYRDTRVLITATLVVAADHLMLGFFWPESVYGIANPEWWRFLEHAGWVVFEDIVLVLGCRRGLEEMQTLSEREATLEVAKCDVEQQVADRTDELRASGDRYRTLIENTSALPWELEGDSCRIIYVAPQMTTIFGVRPDALAARQVFLEVLHAEDRQAFANFVRRAARGAAGETHHIDSRILGTDGQVMHVRSYVSKQHGWERTGNIFGMSLDITRQKRLELDLSQAQKLESIGQLAAGIAHEINTPVQFVSDNVQFVRASIADMRNVIEAYRALQTAARSASGVEDAARRAAEAETAADLDYLMSNVPLAVDGAAEGLDRIATIVRSMKEFAYPDQTQKTSADLNQAIRSTLVIAHNEYKYVAELHTDFGELPLVRCYLGEINQVILNLLINAAHAIGDSMGDGSPLGALTVRTQRIGDEVQISIGDTGTGIPEAARDKIFDPFFTTKEVGKGSGQGLAIARSVVVNKHAGTLHFETECGKGTTFFIRLPIDVAAEVPHVDKVAA